MNGKGYFWAMQRGEIPPSPIRILLGWQLLDVDLKAGTLRAQFEAKPEFLNPAGVVQGGMLAAMLDNVLGAALGAGLEPGQFLVTLELKTSFLHPARTGTLIGEGRVLRRGKSIAFLEGHLEDRDGNLVAKASATVHIVSTDK
jgi:uncharacterized protein (TIGR00369 family)